MATTSQSPVRTENVCCCHIKSCAECTNDIIGSACLTAEFVSLYVDHLLNQSIEKQFSAFYYGFHIVCDSNALTVSFYFSLDFVCRSSQVDYDPSALFFSICSCFVLKK